MGDTGGGGAVGLARNLYKSDWVDVMKPLLATPN